MTAFKDTFSTHFQVNTRSFEVNFSLSWDFRFQTNIKPVFSIKHVFLSLHCLCEAELKKKLPADFPVYLLVWSDQGLILFSEINKQLWC